MDLCKWKKKKKNELDTTEDYYKWCAQVKCCQNRRTNSWYKNTYLQLKAEIEVTKVSMAKIKIIESVNIDENDEVEKDHNDGNYELEEDNHKY